MEDQKRILIIEDEQLIAMYIESILLKEGYDVVGIIDSGEEVLEKIELLQPDVLLVDVMLAGELTGVETVERIKDTMDVCVVYLTSNSNESVKLNAKKTSPIAFLKKPLDESLLINTIEFSINKHEDFKKQTEKLEKKNKRYKMQLEELNETAQHLATATLRERDIKKQLQSTLDELNTSKLIITEQNKSISSINYAKRIQEAIIPRISNIKKDIPNTNWFYKSKDVVSGDFPYYYKKGNLSYYAAVDCTGHGVPGAMMSLIGYLLLNDILSDKEIYSPAEVLLELHKGVVTTLKQDHYENKAADGMDIALCCFDLNTKKLEYAGAHRPLYQVKGNGELIQYKGAKYPIGGNQHKGENIFINHDIPLDKGDKIYLFTDGFPDQFGGKDNLKFGAKRLRKLLEENAVKSINENISILSEKFEEWKGNGKQIDDVLIIGMELN